MNISTMFEKRDICFTLSEYKTTIQNICGNINIWKPVAFIIIAFVLDLVETFYLREYDENILFFKIGFYELKSRDVWIMISSAKSLCLIVAAALLFMGAKAWT